MLSNIQRFVTASYPEPEESSSHLVFLPSILILKDKI
jgi:hypothetical protein